MCFLAVIHIYYKSHCKSFDSLYVSLLPVAILIANAVPCAGCVLCGYSEISPSPDLSLNLPSPVHVRHCSIYLWYLFFLIHLLCLWGTPKLSTWAFFIKAQPRQPLEACSVGGKQLHARHTAGCVLLAFPPFKSLFKLFSSLTAVFYYTRIFSPQFLWQGENLGGGDGGRGSSIYSGLVLISTHPWPAATPPWPA